MIVFGVLLPIVETAMSGTLLETQMADSIFEIILFSVSLLWFLYFLVDVYIYLWRRNKNQLNPAFQEFYTHETDSTNAGLYVRIGCGCKFYCLRKFYSMN